MIYPYELRHNRRYVVVSCSSPDVSEGIGGSDGTSFDGISVLDISKDRIKQNKRLKTNLLSYKYFLLYVTYP